MRTYDLQASPRVYSGQTIKARAIGWSGPPRLSLRRPKEPSTFWRRSWINNVSMISENFASAFRISQDRGSGIIIHGTRERTDYRVSSAVILHLGASGGLAARVQGLRRYYALLLETGDRVRLVKIHDDARMVLAEAPCRWILEREVALEIEVRGATIVATVDGSVVLRATDSTTTPFENGGIGLVITEGACGFPHPAVEPGSGVSPLRRACPPIKLISSRPQTEMFTWEIATVVCERSRSTAHFLDRRADDDFDH